MKHETEKKREGKKHETSKAGKLKIHGGFKAMEHEKVAPRKK
jgi:hypothetical protein